MSGFKEAAHKATKATKNAIGNAFAEKDNALHHKLDDELYAFKRLLKKVSHKVPAPPGKVDEAELIELFEVQWKADATFCKEPWDLYRGLFGESVLHWIELLKSVNDRSTPFGSLLVQLLGALLKRKPALFQVAYTEEPFTGQTLLMLAVANGSEEDVDFLLPFCASPADVNASASGRFILDKMTPPDYPEVHMKHASILEVAAVAPIDNAVAERLVLKLMEAGANPEPADASTSLLHRLAVARWRVEPSGTIGAGPEVFGDADGEFIEGDRLRTLMRHVLKGGSAFQRQASISSEPGVSTSGKQTPLQMAAIVGNDAFIVEYLRFQQEIVWQWGHRREVRLPLKEVDPGAVDHSYPSVLELLAINKHRQTLKIGIFASLVNDKWNRFGRRLTWWKIGVQLFYILLVTFGCLGASAGIGDATDICRRSAIIIACVLVSFETICWLHLRKTVWSQSLNWLASTTRLGCDEVGARMDWAVIVLGLILSLVHEAELWMTAHRSEMYYNKKFFVVMDSLSAVFIFLSWMVLLRFLKLFRTTTVLISVLPVIIRRDMPPWIIVYTVILFATAGSIRVSVWHEVKASDEVLGNVFKAALTLEEATHGPDVQWRNLVMQQPLMAGVFFLMFLWVVTIVMMNLLINIFSNTFDVRRQNGASELLYWRAVEVIQISKAIPDYIPDWCHPTRMSQEGDVQTMEAPPGSPEESSSLVKEAKIHKDTWLAITECVGYDEWSSASGQAATTSTITHHDERGNP
jgi:hypothetical protein